MALTALAVVGLGLSAAGTVIGVTGQMKQAKALEQSEALRKQQMQLDAQRERQKVSREGVVAHANALAAATGQGAGLGSGLQGGFDQITSDVNRQTTNINQNEKIGGSLFDAYGRADAAGGQASIGQGLTSLGNGIVNNLSTFQRIGFG